jgi:hypothetical protein
MWFKVFVLLRIPIRSSLRCTGANEAENQSRGGNIFWREKIRLRGRSRRQIKAGGCSRRLKGSRASWLWATWLPALLFVVNGYRRADSITPAITSAACEAAAKAAGEVTGEGQGVAPWARKILVCVE